MNKRNHIILIVLVAGMLLSTTVFAQEDTLFGPEEPAVDQPPAEEPPSETAQPEGKKDKQLKEDPNKKYHLLGLRLRWIFVPKWFVTMFGVDTIARDMPKPMVSNVGFGAEYTYRKDNFDITAAMWWAGLSWDGLISFKGSGEGDNSWETVSNGLSAFLFTADFIWSTPIQDWVAITYGFGAGFGIPIGEIRRTEASGASGYLDPCITEGVGEGCGVGEEYNEVYKVPTGIVPWINLLIGARFKPHKNVAIYTDVGFGIGFQMGIRGGYIFN